MKPSKNEESINNSKNFSLNRINSVPSLKSKSYYITNKNKSKVILINKHIIKHKDKDNEKNILLNKNINRSTGNLFNDKELNAIEESPKYNIKTIKKINPLMSLDKNNSLILPEMKPKLNYKSKSSINFYIKTMVKEKAEGRIMSNEEIFLLLKAKCKDIGINFRENMYFKFKEFCNSKCKNRVADFSECNFSINSVRIITMILLDTNRISRLDLSRNNIGNLGVEIIVNSLKDSKSLLYLNLSSNSITHKGGHNIFNSFIYQQSIIDLNLSSIEGSNRNRITEYGMQNIPLYLNHNFFIETLNLSGNSIKNEGFILICQGLQKNQTLQNLDISNNSINEKGLKKGFDIISSYNKLLTNIINFNISNNPLTNTGLEILASNLKYVPNLVFLNISFCSFDFKGFQIILKTLQHMKKIDNLNVAGNNFKSDNFFALKEFFAMFGIRYLNMSKCSLGDRGGYYLGECLSSNDTLKYLNLSANNISDLGFKGIATIFKFNKSLEIFDCSCNFISNNSASELFKNLENNFCLKSINFHDNQLNDEICSDILNLLEINNSLIHINLSLNRIQIKAIDDINKKLKLNSEKKKINIVPEIEKSIRDLEFKPEQFQTLSKIIIEKKNWLKTSYKKLKEEDKNYKIIMVKEKENLQKEKINLEKVKKERKIVENAIKEICKEIDNINLINRKKENQIKSKIQKEKIKLKDILQEKNFEYQEYQDKKNQIMENVHKVEKEFNLINNRYTSIKNDYEAKEKEYIEKFRKYQELLDPSLLVKVKSEDNNNIEENKISKIKIKLPKKNIAVKYNDKINDKNNINNMAYKTTTLTTGNTAKNKNYIEEKKLFNLEKK